jgi:hypothetical protein
MGENLRTTQCPFCFHTEPHGFEGTCPWCGEETGPILRSIRYGADVRQEDRSAFARLKAIFSAEQAVKQ